MSGNEHRVWYFEREERGCIQCGLPDHNAVPGNGCYAYLVDLFGSWEDAWAAYLRAKAAYAGRFSIKAADGGTTTVEIRPENTRAAGYEEGYRAGIEAAAKLMEENAAEWRKASRHTQPDIAYQLDAEARHIRELLKERNK